MPIKQTTTPVAFPDVCITDSMTKDLVRRGISQNGVHQLMAGEIVAALGDRLVLSRLLQANVKRGKDQDVEVENDETHWVGHDRKKLRQRAAMTNVGMQQCLSGFPVTAASDRQALLETVCAIYKGGARGGLGAV